MQLPYRFLTFLFLTAALTAPLATRTAAQEVVIQRNDGDHTRYYDRGHHDYHNWNEREERSYRIYLGERHRDYREFRHASHGRQTEYWRWRHSHPDHD